VVIAGGCAVVAARLPACGAGGGGVTEAGVRRFNKRVIGTEQFWNLPTVEPILALRALWLSNDDRRQHYWLYGAPLRQAA